MSAKFLPNRKPVVVDENTLGVIIPEGNCIQILQASVLRGSAHPASGTIAIPDESRMRDATIEDFNAYRVSWEGYFTNEEIANQMQSYYAKLPNLGNVHAVKVTLTHKGEAHEFFGIFYQSFHKYTESMRAVTNGDKKAGDTYTEECFLLLGKRPKILSEHVGRGHHMQSQKNLGRIGDLPSDWYVTHYWNEDQYNWSPYEKENERIRKCHPFGSTFGLGCKQPDNDHAYVYMPMTFTYLSSGKSVP